MPAPHTYNLFVLSFRKNNLLTQNHTWFLLIYPWEAKGRSRNEGSEERGTRNASGNAQGPGGVPIASATLAARRSRHVLPTQNTFLNNTVQFC